MPAIRITLALVGLFSAFALSPIVTILCMTAIALRYAAWEVIVLGLFMDFLWLPAGSAFPLFTLLGIVLVWGLLPLRRELFLP